MLQLPPEIILAFIAVALATASAIYFFLYGLSLLPFQQHATPPGELSNPSQDLEDRGQGTEFESLGMLGFEFMGTCRESCGFAGLEDHFLFAHSEFPVTCKLSQNSDNTISTSMFSDDGDERFLVTTNIDTLQRDHDHRTLFLQVDPIAKLEEILRAHISSLEVWEKDGFTPIQISNLAEMNSQSKRFQNHPEFRKLLMEVALLVPLGIGLINIGSPAFIAGAAWYFLKATPWAISASTAIMAFGALSSLISIHLIHSLFRQPSGKKGSKPKAKRITKKFRLPVDSIGFSQFEFSNKAWANRIKNRRWLIVLGGVFFFIALNPFFVIPVLFILITTRAKRIFANKSVISFNDQYLTRKRFWFFGQTNRISNNLSDQKLRFKDITMLRLEPGPNDSISLVADYLFDSPKDIFQAAGISKPKKNAHESSLVIVDSSWGFERAKIRELVEALRHKRKMQLVESAEPPIESMGSVESLASN